MLFAHWQLCHGNGRTSGGRQPQQLFNLSKCAAIDADSFAMSIPQCRHLLDAGPDGIFSALLCGVDHRQDTRCCATILHPCFEEVAVSESDNSRKHALECLRLEADCMQLAGVVRGPALQTHFVRMAGEWSSLAVQGPKAGAQTRTYLKIV